MSTGEKLIQMVIAIALFFAIVAAILLLTQRFRSRRGELVQAAGFVLPATILIALGLLYPAIKTIYLSFRDSYSTTFVGLDNYKTVFTSKAELTVLGNTAMWVVITPIAATLIGLVYAVLVDHARMERLAKALIFLPMAISLVGASIIWKFVYDPRVGLLDALTGKAGLGSDHVWYANPSAHPWNNIWLIVILIWVQTGFAMTVLSAAIKAIPTDIVEAARLDGVGGFKMFRYITVPSIRPTVVVVLTTITITTLKAFDIIQTISAGGAYHTSVLAYEFYFQAFKAFNSGLSAALAVLIFVLVLPIVIYNVRQMRKADAR
jgi:alpha-glucoside transport system permease protein